MKTASPELVALLNSSTQFLMADLLTIALASGTTLRYTTADKNIAVGANTFSAKGPLITRGQVRLVRGLEVDTLDLNIMAKYDNAAHTIDGEPFISSSMSGALDGAEVLLERAFLSDWALAPVGTIVLFSGCVSDVSGTGTKVRITVKSDLELLNVNLPRNLYQASCLHTVYDTGCAVTKSLHTVTGNVTGNDGTGQWLQSGLSQESFWFDQGVITFTSGLNVGLKRTVKAYDAGEFSFALPLPNVPQVGDAFSVFPGCDKTQSTCESKFSNLPRFRGYPYIPIAETAI